jgi:uncharacterized protein (TIGR01777 family)
MLVALSGSTGLIGSALAPALREAGHEVLELVRREPSGPGEVGWDPEGGSLDAAALEGVDAILHLAGENIGKRWTRATRQRVLDSRVKGTRLLAETAAQLERPPAALVCASATGFYGDRGDEVLTEESARGGGFLADVVDAWEHAAEPARDAGIRTVHLRQGIVLSRHGGALAKLLLPFRLGLGGRVGSGRQWWSWVGLDDVVAAYLYALDHPLAGPVNVTAPGVVTNREFTKAVGRALHRPTAVPLPGFAVRAMFGQMGVEMLLGGQRTQPSALTAAGFSFGRPVLDAALEHALRN